MTVQDSPRSASEPAIRIAGLGILSPLGIGVETTFKEMLAGQCGIHPISRFSLADYPQKNGGQLTENDESHLLDTFPADSLAISMIEAAGREAMAMKEDATVPAADPELGLILSSNFGAMDLLEWCWRERLDTNAMDPETFHNQQNMLSEITRRLGVDGPCAQVSLSCASGTAAVALARQWLRLGRSRRVLVIGYDLLTEFCWYGLANLRTITDDCIRPFDTDRRGTIFSEGAAALLLETTDDPGPDDLLLLGASTNNNAFHLTAPTKEAEGSRCVMEQALAQAGITGAQLDFISAHGTGTTANDVTESQAILRLTEPADIPVAAFKSALGHMLGAAGTAEIVMTAEALRQGILPPILNQQQQDEACQVRCVTHPLKKKFSLALTNSAGIGGSNAAAVLGRGKNVIKNSQKKPGPPRKVGLKRAGWVLPQGIGAGTALPEFDRSCNLTDPGKLTNFSVKPYLHSIKGYLDPTGAYALAAVALCLGEDRDGQKPRPKAIVSATRYGAPISGMTVFRQAVTRGPRFASPMMFPHSYASTPANLAAIEFGLNGPHMIFSHCPDHEEALQCAAAWIRQQEVDDVLLLCFEAVTAEVVPDNTNILNGAVCLWLSASDQDAELPHATRHAAPQVAGTVYSLLTPNAE